MEAAKLFAEAIQLMPSQRLALLKEYADQLSFCGKAPEAIPLYQEFLSQPNLLYQDRASAQKSLAQAYDWSDRSEEARSIYAQLVQTYPDDVSVKWSLLVYSAHVEAKADRNKEAANLLAQAMDLIPAKRLLILKEYADKLTYSGNAKKAIPLYRELIGAGNNETVLRGQRLSLALALAWNNQLPEA